MKLFHANWRSRYIFGFTVDSDSFYIFMFRWTIGLKWEKAA